MNTIENVENFVGFLVILWVYYHVVLWLACVTIRKHCKIPKNKLTIAVDFDGTIVKNAWPSTGKPRLLAPAVLKWLKKRGHCLVLWTCREDSNGDYYLSWAQDFLEEHDMDFDYFNNNSEELKKLYGNDTRKIGADWYIDDKAGFLGWWSIPFIILWLERTVKR
jgi:hypothetical protein